MTIGRADANDIVIDSPAISNSHAKIITFNKAAYIQDLGSTNGTCVNGIKNQHQRLREGDQVKIGDYIFTIAGFV
jgi:pSer/pThr/pTyr-binding forkhead associated (FHA) protein